MIVGGELEKARMEAHPFPVPFENGRAKVVIQTVAGASLEVPEGVDVATQEVLQRLVQEEAQAEPPRKRQRQQKRRKRPPRSISGRALPSRVTVS